MAQSNSLSSVSDRSDVGRIISRGTAANDEMQASPFSERGRCRGPDGRYYSTRVKAMLEDRKLKRQRKYERMMMLAGTRAFERLLDNAFLTGSENEWVPSSRGIGPIADIASLLFKRKFLVSSRRQGELMRAAYFHGDVLKKMSDLPRVSARASNNPNGRKSVVRVYRGRRLPRLSGRTHEVRAIKRWINECIELDLFKVCDKDKAYEVVRKCITTHSLIEGHSSYVGYPSFKSPTSEGSEEISRAGTLEPSRHSPVPECTCRVQNSAVLPRRDGTERATGEEPSADAISESQLRARWANAVIACAKNDRFFKFMCIVVEEDGGSRLGMVARVLQDICRTEGISLTSVMRDVLNHAHDLHLGVSDAQEHVSRLGRIKGFVADLKAARTFIRMPGFQEMSWRVSGGPRQENGQVTSIEGDASVWDTRGSTLPGSNGPEDLIPSNEDDIENSQSPLMRSPLHRTAHNDESGEENHEAQPPGQAWTGMSRNDAVQGDNMVDEVPLLLSVPHSATVAEVPSVHTGSRNRNLAMRSASSTDHLFNGNSSVAVSSPAGDVQPLELSTHDPEPTFDFLLPDDVTLTPHEPTRSSVVPPGASLLRTGELSMDSGYWETADPFAESAACDDVLSHRLDIELPDVPY